MIKACIFDLDGVIVDTAKYHFTAWRRMANAVGFDFDEQQNEKLKGVGRMQSLELILEWGGVTKTEAEKLGLAQQKNAWYQALIADMTPDEILGGVLPFLENLRAEGIPFALGSASRNAPIILERIGLTTYFTAIIDGNKTTRSKPDPQVFELGATAMNVLPAECVVFEDAVKGIQAAKTGGFYVVGVGERETLNEADWIISSFEGVTLAEIIKRIGA